jgi:hypothetical protein
MKESEQYMLNGQEKAKSDIRDKREASDRAELSS